MQRKKGSDNTDEVFYRDPSNQRWIKVYTKWYFLDVAISRSDLFCLDTHSIYIIPVQPHSSNPATINFEPAIALNPTLTYVQRVLDWIEFILIPHQLNFPFTLYHTTATILYITQPLWFQQRSRCYKKVQLFKCNKSNINVRTKSIRLHWILFNTSSTQFPILLYIS